MEKKVLILGIAAVLVLIIAIILLGVKIGALYQPAPWRLYVNGNGAAQVVLFTYNNSNANPASMVLRVSNGQSGTNYTCASAANTKLQWQLQPWNLGSPPFYHTITFINQFITTQPPPSAVNVTYSPYNPGGFNASSQWVYGSGASCQVTVNINSSTSYLYFYQKNATGSIFLGGIQTVQNATRSYPNIFATPSLALQVSYTTTIAQSGSTTIIATTTVPQYTSTATTTGPSTIASTVAGYTTASTSIYSTTVPGGITSYTTTMSSTSVSGGGPGPGSGGGSSNSSNTLLIIAVIAGIVVIGILVYVIKYVL